MPRLLSGGIMPTIPKTLDLLLLQGSPSSPLSPLQVYSLLISSLHGQWKKKEERLLCFKQKVVLMLCDCVYMYSFYIYSSAEE